MARGAQRAHGEAASLRQGPAAPRAQDGPRHPPPAAALTAVLVNRYRGPGSGKKRHGDRPILAGGGIGFFFLVPVRKTLKPKRAFVLSGPAHPPSRSKLRSSVTRTTVHLDVAKTIAAVALLLLAIYVVCSGLPADAVVKLVTLLRP